MKNQKCFDSIFWIGGGTTGKYGILFKEELNSMSDEVIFLFNKDEIQNLWANYTFSEGQKRGWVVALRDPSDPTVVENFLMKIVDLPGTNYVSLLTMGVNNELLIDISKRPNIVLFYDIIRGAPTIEFVKKVVTTLQFTPRKEETIYLKEIQGCLIGTQKGTHTRTLLKIKQIIESYGIKKIELYSEPTYKQECTQYFFQFLDNNWQCSIFSKELFAKDAMESLKFIASYNPCESNWIIGNVDRFKWFPII